MNGYGLIELVSQNKLFNLTLISYLTPVLRSPSYNFVASVVSADEKSTNPVTPTKETLLINALNSEFPAVDDTI